MAKKNKVRIDRVIILILAFILVFGALGFGVYKLFGLFFNDDKKIDNKPVVVETTASVSVSLIDYSVYKDDTDDLGFDFIIADLSFTANEPVSFELKNLQTSEKISLDKIDSYINALELAGYKVDDLGINTTGVNSAENKTEARVFIPFKTDTDTLAVYNAVNASKLEFNLDENVKLATSLKLDNEDSEKVIEVEGAKIEVSNSYISSTMYHNDVEYGVSSTSKIFTFRINATDIEEGTKIVKAQFIRNGESDPIDCLPADYSSLKDDNAFEKPLVNGDNGALFFEIITNEVKPSFSGDLLITFSNSDKVYKIETVHE